MEGSPNNRKCSRCGKVFKSRKSCSQHIKDKHEGKGVRVGVKREEERSMASLFIEGYQNRAMGIANEDWLEDML